MFHSKRAKKGTLEWVNTHIEFYEQNYNKKIEILNKYSKLVRFNLPGFKDMMVTMELGISKTYNDLQNALNIKEQLLKEGKI